MDESFGIVPQQDGTDSTLALRDQNRAQRALTHRKANLHVGATRTIVARSHAEHAVRGRVEAAVRIEACAVDRIRHFCTLLAEFFTQLVRAESGRVAFRRQSRLCLEDPVEMEGAHADLFGELVQVRRRLRTLDQTTGFGEHRCALHRDCCPIAGGTLTCTKASRASRSLGVEELDVLTIGKASRSARAAEDAGRADSIDEMPVRPYVTRLDRCPALLDARIGGTFVFRFDRFDRIHVVSLDEISVLTGLRPQALRFLRLNSASVESASVKGSAAPARWQRNSGAVCGVVEHALMDASCSSNHRLRWSPHA